MGDPSPNLRPSMQHFQASSPIDENVFPMLSDAEEAEMDRARSSGFRDTDTASEHSAGYRLDEQDEDLTDRSRTMSHHGDSHGSASYDPHARLARRHSDEGDHRRERTRHDRELERFSGMLGGSTGPANRFDFRAMEDFAAAEREKLGLSDTAKIPVIPIAPQQLRQRPSRGQSQDPNGNVSGSYDTSMERTNTVSAFGDDTEQVTSPKENEGGHTFARRRQRKLSSSNPVGRRGGKLALFEGFGQYNDGDESAPPVKASRHPKNALPIGPTGGGIMPYSDNAPGHDRPYRFSFYSNSLPVTIHARTLAELPAEGQSFEDLFRGRATAGSSATQQGNEGVDAGSILSADRWQNGVETPRDDHTPTPRDVPHTGKQSLLARAAGAALHKSSSHSSPAPQHPDQNVKEDDPEAATWWLDVLSPTDEEMRMLAGVSFTTVSSKKTFH